MSRSIATTRPSARQEIGAPAPVELAGAERTRQVLRFQAVSKKYTHNASRMLLRRGVLSWFRRNGTDVFYALRNVSFELGAATSLAVVGANGAGKSTLLRCATGISTPEDGRVEVRGTIAALMELGAGFHPDLTGAENVVLNASLLGLTRKETYEQFEHIVEFSGLSKFIDEPLRTYSSGMVLRLAFSVAVRVDPDILVIDEILAVGDIDFQEKCVAEIMRLKNSGKTLVYVAHDIKLLRKLCEQALWLEHGEVRMFGPSAEVLDAYEAAPPPTSL
jgi:ABC-type polysaccharide/polyol phosphate transport system ATPase subunit